MATRDGRASYMFAQTIVGVPALEAALYLVATPIGNLGDITIRALETIAAADIVACEDTRVSRILLNRYGIVKRPVAYHEHNAERATPTLLNAIADGRSVALICDAGTPLVSDPGHRLVERTLELGLRIVPIPGPSSVLSALTLSGLPVDSFFFAGFLPVKAGQRRSRLEKLKAIPGTLVLFESPRRLAASLADMTEVLGGNRQAAIAREMTKKFEECTRGTLNELRQQLDGAATPKGEIVVCIGATVEDEQLTPFDVDDLLLSLAQNLPASRAAAEAARLSGQEKSVLYRRLTALKERKRS